MELNILNLKLSNSKLSNKFKTFKCETFGFHFVKFESLNLIQKFWLLNFENVLGVITLSWHPSKIKKLKAITITATSKKQRIKIK